MEEISAEEVFQQWGRHKKEFLAWQKMTLRRQKYDKRLALEKLGWQEADVKKLPSEANLAKEYLTKKYGQEGLAAAPDSADWERDYVWEALWEGEDAYPQKTRTGLTSFKNRESKQTKDGKILGSPLMRCAGSVSNKVPKSKDSPPKINPKTVPKLHPVVLTTKELAKELPSTTDTLKRQAANASMRGSLPQPLEGFPDWFVVEKSDPRGGQGRGWKFQARHKSEEA